MNRLSMFGAVAVMGMAGLANAGTITYNDFYGFSTTNWSQNLTVLAWNPASYPGQQLVSVVVKLTGDVQGTAKYESLDASPADISLNLQATINLNKPAGGALTQVIPVANITETAAAYDGTTDFDGPSGSTFAGLSGSDNDTQTLTLPADLALFTGAGNVSMAASATGSSNGSGAGNLLTQFNTDAKASIEVTYNWAPIPEPASLGLLSLGGLALIRRRRDR